MGDCTYCGKPAGFLKSRHKECEQASDEGWSAMRLAVRRAALKGRAQDDNELIDLLERLANDARIPFNQIRQALSEGWASAVDGALEDGILSPDEQAALLQFQAQHSLTKNELDATGAYSRAEKAIVLRHVLEGRLPDIKVEGVLPFNLQKTEQLVWIFYPVAYYEHRTKREYRGASSGMSIRIAKGVYYRTSAFRGHPVDTTHTVHVDTGSLGFTNKHLYFAGPAKGFRIRLDKIVTTTPYSDGIGVQRDAASAKPQIFVTGDGWFAYNLLLNLSRIE